ncbi:import inner membrane translocase subunit Tim22 [Micractinium conductrix]|uniref:Import inner membrane translocase subunit Tim22 n=1 Tax=Micractinium conductrix TaxID=554055 RepID=A0A2P6VF99_9CHLO|nr:import inner membrane translocase subunit Tim22 [Micractinium conductrix]|eukprot:PSC72764.1 import inner membrane translocase subunit Tim22 [Micractinium conductrix]
MSAVSEVPEAPSTSSSAPPKDQSHLPPGLRKYRRLDAPTQEAIASEDFMNNCVVRTVLSCVLGGGMGVMFGIFMGTMDTGAAMGGVAEYQNQTMRQAFREMAKSTMAKSKSYAKGFAAMGALFAGTECLIESYRAKHDARNSIYAGCATGAILAHSGGPKAVCIGCASFAAFSALIDRFMGH